MTRAPLSPRQEAEAIEGFGDDLARLSIAFDKLTRRMRPETWAAIDAIPHQDFLEQVAEGYRALGDRLCRECDHAEEAEDRRRANPLEPDLLHEARELCAILDNHNAHDGEELVYDFEAIGEEIARRHKALTAAIAKAVRS